DKFTHYCCRRNSLISLQQVNDNFTYQQKLEIVENMWKVAFVDLHNDKYEEHLIRKVCDLIYVTHQDFVRLREAHISN
ncbi:TerB family tellurite resistance protein, partial [Pseudomonadota bacterium]